MDEFEKIFEEQEFDMEKEKQKTLEKVKYRTKKIRTVIELFKGENTKESIYILNKVIEHLEKNSKIDNDITFEPYLTLGF